MSAADEFYEDDEPIEDVRAAFDAGEKGFTAGPRVLLMHPDEARWLTATERLVFDFTLSPPRARVENARFSSGGEQ